MEPIEEIFWKEYEWVNSEENIVKPEPIGLPHGI